MSPPQSSNSLSALSLFLALLCPLSVVGLSYYLKLNIIRKILVSVSRTIIQLLLAGYVLLGFIFSMRSPVYVIGYLLLMVAIASIEVTSRQVRTYVGHYRDSFISVVMGGAFVGAYGSIIVFNPTPWWEPHVMVRLTLKMHSTVLISINTAVGLQVPTAGMIIGNAISGPALAVDRYYVYNNIHIFLVFVTNELLRLLAEIADKRHEPETRLCFGATRFEAVLPTIRSAVLAALMPNLNQMAVVGLVAIPGMMTGQLLGGASPLVAAQYQMAILWLIFATAAFSTLSSMALAISHAVFDEQHRLTPERIVKVQGGKSSFEKVVFKAASTAASSVYNCLKRSFGLTGVAGTGTGISNYELLPTEGEGGGSASDSASSSSKLAETIDNIGDGKVNFTLATNVPTSNYRDTQTLHPQQSPLFEVAGLNVMSGEETLFGKSGISFALRQGEVMTVEGPSGLGKTR